MIKKVILISKGYELRIICIGKILMEVDVRGLLLENVYGRECNPTTVPDPSVRI